MKKRFHKINIEISNICNLQCSFCPEVMRPKKVMEKDLFKSIIEQAAPMTELVCLHLMGDPLVHPELESFVKICEENSTKIFLVTNGVLLREKQKQILHSPIFHQINFSLHSFPDNFPEKDPTIYLKKIFSFVDEVTTARPDLYINFRLWNLDAPNGKNQKNLEMLSHLEEHYNWSFPSAVDVRQNKSLKIKNRTYLHLDTEFTWPSLNLPVLGTKGTCYGLKSHIGVLVDGTVVPCCLDNEGAIPLGNIKDSSLADILSGPRAEAMRLGFQQNKLIEDLCQRCQYIERFQ